jgi:hypothetical protein
MSNFNIISSRFIRFNLRYKMLMLFGVLAVHSPELCPLHNKNSKKIFLDLQKKIKANQKKLNILKIVGFYVSVLEHQWVVILDAKNAHDIEQLCISVGISAISTVKIVPINDFNKVVSKMQSV